MSSAPYDVREVIVIARPVAGVQAQIPRGRVAQELGRHLDQVYAAARAGAAHLHGQNIFIYRATTADQLTVDFCVGVTAPFTAVGAVVPLETPHGVAAMTTHYGDYARLGETNASILAWCRANDRLRAGPSWEVYGHWHAEPARLRTEIYHLLWTTGVRARPYPPRSRRGWRGSDLCARLVPDTALEPTATWRIYGRLGDSNSIHSRREIDPCRIGC